MRILSFVLMVVVVFAVMSLASAAAPTRIRIVDAAPDPVLAEVCGFTVINGGDVLATIHPGDPTFIKMQGVAYLEGPGGRLTGNVARIVTASESSVTIKGLVWHVVVPGEGVVTLDAGVITIDLVSGMASLVRGPHPFVTGELTASSSLAKLCNYID